MKEENNTKKDFELFEDLCDTLQLIKEKYIYLELKFTKKDSVKNDKIILGIDRMWALSYFYTNEDLKVYPLKISGKIIESIKRNFENSNFTSINEYDVFLLFINEVNEYLDEIYEQSKEITKLLINEMPNVYELNEDYNSLKKHKKDLINYDYSVKQHLGIEKIDSIDFFIKHIDEQQKFLTYKSSQIIKEKVVINESIEHPFTSPENLELFHFIDERLKIGGKISRYSYILSLFKDTLDEKTTETKYFNYVNSLEKNQGKKISIQYNISTRNKIGKEIERLYKEFLKINKS